MTTIAAVTDAVLRRLGVSPSQCRLLVALFRSLGERREMLGGLSTDPHALRLATMMLVLPGALFALFAFGRAPLSSYNLMVLSVSSLVLFLLLVPEALNSFLNPAEVTVLAHQPIEGRTYFVAKFVYLVGLVLRAETALNGPAALAGLVKPDARWFYPVTHMAGAYLLGLFLALVACACLGVLFRVVPTSRLRSAGLWMQLVATLLPVAANLMQNAVRRWSATLSTTVAVGDWSFSPLLWFHAIGMMGHGPSPVSFGWPLAVGITGATTLIGFGVRALSAGYLSRIVGVMRASGRRRARLRGPIAALWRQLPVAPATKAGIAFVLRMMRRDWQFRRNAAGLVLLLVMIAPVVVLSARRGSPFDPGGIHIVGLFPEILSVGTLMVCMILPFSDHFRASWIFATVPATAFRAFGRGVYWALWLPWVATPIAAGGIYFARHWGAVDAGLFTVYGLAVASLLLALQLFIVEGLPFGAAPKAERPFMMMPLIIFGPVVFGVAWVLQSALFRSRLSTAGATILIAVAAGFARRASVAHIETASRASVARVTTGT